MTPENNSMPVDLFVSEARKPKYGRIQDQVLRHIRRGDWAPGDRIPPERELARRFDASVGTVRNAMQALVSQGYLSREQGRGTFVRKSIGHTDALRYFRFVDSFADHVPPLTIKCLHPPRVEIRPEVSDILGQAAPAKILKISRLFLLDQQPLVYVTSYLPRTLFHDFDKFTPRALEETPIYLLVEQAYNMPTLATNERFCAVAADKEVARKLQIKTGTPVQKILMTAMTTRRTVYEYQVSYCNTTDRQIFRECPGQTPRVSR